MRQVVSFCLTVVLSLLVVATATAQETFRVVRGDCISGLSVDGGDASLNRAPQSRRLPAMKTDWDPERVYKQMVILVEFSEGTEDTSDDTKFNRDDARGVYDQIFNQKGYNERQGVGCVADYFRDQSNGLFNLSFDVFGPYLVNQKAKSSSSKNLGAGTFREAAQKMIAANPNHDFSVYDWDGNGTIEQVIFVYAGLGGNTTDGYIWPNTGSFTSVTTPDGKRINNYTASAEHWPTTKKASCGIGTICHEFSHSLGLPDIYPAHNTSWSVSVCDEWDLMDGGNFTNYGWCPPNYTALEKYLLGWLSFEELTGPTTITGLKPVSEGGAAYRIKHSSSEWLVLENRQWTGWDSGMPGKGLVVYHVYYDGSVWRGNSVNDSQEHPRFILMPADNLNYNQWRDQIGDESPYAVSDHMNNRILSTSSYPYVTDGVVMNNRLTDDSTPASTMYFPNEQGSAQLAKPLTNIVLADDGSVSFDFMGGDPTGIREVDMLSSTPAAVYDLSGRAVQRQGRSIFVIRQSDGTVRKVFK